MLIKSELLAEENFLWRSNLPGGSIAPGGVCVTCNFAEPCAAVKLDCRCIVFVDVQQHYAALLLLACLGLADSDKFLAYAPAPGSWSHCHVIDLDNWRAPLKIKKLRNVAIAFVDGYLPHSKYFLSIKVSGHQQCEPVAQERQAEPPQQIQYALHHKEALLDLLPKLEVGLGKKYFAKQGANLGSYWHNLATSVGGNVNPGSSRPEPKPKPKPLSEGVKKGCCSDCH